METVEPTVPLNTWTQIFTFLPEFGVLICLEHHCAIRLSSLDRHISAEHSIFRKEKKLLLKELSHLEIRNPIDVVHPGRITSVIKELNIVSKNAFQCLVEECNYCCLGLKKMQSHCRSEHQWKHELNPNPIWEAAHLQTFFTHKSYIKYFRVAITESRVIDSVSINDRTLQAFRESQTLLVKCHTSIQPIEHKSENTPWMTKTGYREYLQGLPCVDIIKSYQLPKGKNNETCLEGVCKSLDRILNKALKSATNERGNGHLTLANARILNTFQSGTLSQKPFKALQNQEMAKSYFSVWKKLIYYIYRIHYNNAFPEITIFKLTTQQLSHINTSFSQLNNEESLDNSCLSMSYSLIEHPLEFDSFESPIISFSAALCLNSTGSSFLEPHHFTPFLSRLIYCIQLITLEYNLVNYEINKEDNQSFQNYFKIACDKWILNTTVGPMSELLSTRLYGMEIGRNTIAPMTTYWDEAREVVTYRSTELAISDLRRFMKEQLFVAKQILYEKLLFFYNPELKFNFSVIKDDFGQKNVGESFLTNKCNGFEGSGEWLFQAILNDQKLLNTMADCITDGNLVWKLHIILQYEHQIQSFLNHLLILIHMGSG
ncbi:hypothetical protein NEOLI_004805 [Neolecta irregularis DAH-3]|uniref:C2H2-type domain-containing protein n=1 Tax=Neolecta irregularis (strain DAH-3) TaxID=1198029 RepID=A0A1U7LU66_NEOID|nr:hypothetical protein NEOLI_004805 [Neolecta irregularis DAH-3]|eukprot:OLL26207.1 hypothetical protein NEOLI_004805 [Neolecta irregularis DAH-3]